MTFFLFNLLNGLQLSMLIFLMAIGLTVIFGLMDILNLAHGAFYMAGAYFGYVVFQATGSFWIALAIAPLLPLILGFLLQYFVLQPLIDNGRSAHLDMALLTFGLLFFTIGLIDLIFFETMGLTFMSIDKPAGLGSYVDHRHLLPRLPPVHHRGGAGRGGGRVAAAGAHRGRRGGARRGR